MPDEQLTEAALSWSICDIVMKGGITSGIVYPSAVCELAKFYRFKNVGGTSAGAIAAATTAAAEHGRITRKGGFQELATLPPWLATGANLKDLFQPSKATRALFTLGLAFLGQDSPWIKAFRAMFAALVGYPFWIVVCLAIAVMVVVFGKIFGGADLAQWIAGIVLLLAIPCVTIASLVWADVKGALTDNGFGLCNGNDKTLKDAEPLTVWLTDKLDSLAGISSRDPLTFGDLWQVRLGGNRRNLAGPAAQNELNTDPDESDYAPLPDNNEREINLRMITSCLTLGHPFGLPFETRRFFFTEEDAFKYFPPRVAELMVRRKATPRSVREAIVSKLVGDTYLPFPLPEDTPVVVAARMSLSFPILLSAVPLYAIDWSLPQNEGADKMIRLLIGKYGKSAVDHLDELQLMQVIPEKCWFSDGGISSNFPIQFFDSPLPRWPTFGIDLDPFQPDAKPDPVEHNNVWMPTTNDSGMADCWNRFAQKDRRARIGAFLAAIVDTMQNWVNNAQARTPGYRDRIAHVLLTDKEGGLNLTMPKPTRDAMIARGTAAGALAAAHFAKGSPVQTNWPNHRWVRYRSFLGVAQWLKSAFSDGLVSGQPSYTNLKNYPPSYPYSNEQLPVAIQVEKSLDNAGVAASSPSAISLSDGAPQPCPDLVVRPRL